VCNAENLRSTPQAGTEPSFSYRGVHFHTIDISILGKDPDRKKLLCSF